MWCRGELDQQNMELIVLFIRLNISLALIIEQITQVGTYNNKDTTVKRDIFQTKEKNQTKLIEPADISQR